MCQRFDGGNAKSEGSNEMREWRHVIGGNDQWSVRPLRQENHHFLIIDNPCLLEWAIQKGCNEKTTCRVDDK